MQKTLALAALASLWPVAAWSQPAAPVIDLTVSIGPTNVTRSDPQQLTALRDGRLTFAATEPGTGTEIWGSDGTETGTRLLADVCPGPCTSYPEVLGTTGGVALWAASPFEDQLWRTDGTRDGTFPLTEGGLPLTVRRPYDDESEDFAYLPLPHAFLRGALFVRACGAAAGCGLWRTDGTPAGTRLVAGVPALGGDLFGPILATDRAVFFKVGGDDPGLWRTDGSAAGTVRLTRFQIGPRALTAAGSLLFFTAAAESGGEELWATDGTPAGTRRLTQMGPAAPFQSDPKDLPALQPAGRRVYFMADDGVHGPEIWRSDGTAAGTRRVTDFADPHAFGPRWTSIFMTEVGGRLLFSAAGGPSGAALWATDGDPLSTVLLKPCSYLFNCIGVWSLGSRGLFFFGDGVQDRELWSTDGTPQGTRLLRDFCPGSCSSFLSFLGPLPGGLAFRVRHDGSDQLWISNGTDPGTRLLARFRDGIFLSDTPPVSADGRIFFSAVGGDDLELWVLEGGGTAREVANIAPETPSSLPRELTPVGDRLFFQAFSDGTTANRFQALWQTRGTADTTTQVLESIDSPSLYCFSPCPPDMVDAGGWLAFLQANEGVDDLWRSGGSPGDTAQLTHFAAQDKLLRPLVVLQGRVLFFRDHQNHLELWRSDGTAAGTVRVAELPRTAFTISSARGFAALGGEAWFSFPREEGWSIWRTDGTPEGTSEVTTLPPALEISGLPFTRAGNRVFFATLSKAAPRIDQLWASDGTPQGTAPIAGSEYFRVYELRDLGGTLYFSASVGSLAASRTGLWRSDGTAAGTLPILDSFKGFRFSPHSLTPFAGRLFFAADNGSGGIELWVSDGTPGGTAMLKDINPRGDSSPDHLIVAGGRLYFTAFDGVHGFELWQSDGTAQGTRLVQDIAPEGLSSWPDALTVAGDRLYFTADDGAIGREVWSLPLTGDGAVCHPSATALCLGGRYRVETTWRDPLFHRGAGTAVPLPGGGDTGAFWFFDPANLELVVKVLDGRGVNGHVWVFYGALSDVAYTVTVTDAQTGLTRRYFNPQGQLASVGDTHAFGPQGAKSKTPEAIVAPPSPPPFVAERQTGTKAACAPASDRLCLNGGRFAVEIAWKDFQGHTGAGTTVPLTGDTGAFWFFNAANLELIVKVLDGRPVNGKFWVFYGALSNVEYTVTVTDTETGMQRIYKNPGGRFASVAETNAF